MCFGGGPDGPTTTPAPYKPEDSHTAVSMTKTPEPAKAGDSATPKETAAVTPLVGTGLNVKGM